MVAQALRALVQQNDTLIRDTVGDDLSRVNPKAVSYTHLIVVAKIGDAKKVRNLRGAVTDGANIGFTLDLDLMMNANNSPIANLPTEVKVSG